MPSMRFLTESAVSTPPDAAETVASFPLPSPNSILPKLNEDAFKSPSISAFRRLTNAPAECSAARTALSEISTEP